jgi:hypothetical protein
MRQMSKSLELRLYEAYSLIEALEKALALERGGGTPLTPRAYLALRSDALAWMYQNEFVKAEDVS